MVNGSKPTDGGHLLLSPEEKTALINSEPLAEQYIRPFLGAAEFINEDMRYCLWLADTDVQHLNQNLAQMPQVAERVRAVKTMRENSKDKQTQKDATVPHLFQKIRQPRTGNYLLIPSVSSESRKFVPIGYLDYHTVASNLAYSLPNASLYHFGILSSTMHNAWMRTVAGRLKSDYRYSNSIVYNNFPFPFMADNVSEKAEKARQHIAQAAQAVLDARNHYQQQNPCRWQIYTAATRLTPTHNSPKPTPTLIRQ